MLETFNYQLDKQDLIYLVDLLYTIKINEELAAKIIPLKGNPKIGSNFHKVAYKVENLLRLRDARIKPKRIAEPTKSFTKQKKRKFEEHI